MVDKTKILTTGMVVGTLGGMITGLSTLPPEPRYDNNEEAARDAITRSMYLGKNEVSGVAGGLAVAGLATTLLERRRNKEKKENGNAGHGIL